MTRPEAALVAPPQAGVTFYRPAPAWRRLAEAGGEPLSEAELSRIWAAQSFPPEALVLADGRRLRVLLPGRPGGGAGPDYRDAIVAIDGVERHGDVELHVRASSFRGHGHDRDAAYDGVVLHVVYIADDGVSTVLSDGRLTPVAAFAPWLGRRSEELRAWLAAPPLWQEPCSDAVSRLGREAVLDQLALEGRRRLAVKTARLAEAVAALGEEQALWQALLDGLGYGGERAAWHRLAERLPHSLVARLAAGLPAEGTERTVEAALLTVAGLAALPPELAGRLPKALSPPLAGGSRPANRPQRRLAALARLWQRAAGDFCAFSRSTVREATGLTQLTARWTVPGEAGRPALLGQQRARELLLNVVLPFASLDSALAEWAQALTDSLPASPSYGKTAFLEANLGRSEGRLRLSTALQQQGLLAMAADWCRQGGCGRCPLS